MEAIFTTIDHCTEQMYGTPLLLIDIIKRTWNSPCTLMGHRSITGLVCMVWAWFKSTWIKTWHKYCQISWWVIVHGETYSSTISSSIKHVSALVYRRALRFKSWQYKHKRIMALSTGEGKERWNIYWLGKHDRTSSLSKHGKFQYKNVAILTYVIH